MNSEYDIPYVNRQNGKTNLNIDMSTFTEEIYRDISFISEVPETVKKEVTEELTEIVSKKN